MVRLTNSSIAVASLITLGFASQVALAETFVNAPLTDAADSYVAGTGAGAYTNTSAALGKPGAIVGGDNILDPFSPHYESGELSAIGLGGRIAYQFAQPLNVIGAPQIGVFTNAGFNDASYPSGQTEATAHTFTGAAGAERTAVVEVADVVGNWKSLGRVTFNLPTNYYGNATDAYAATVPNGVNADFSKPFTGNLSSFNSESFSQVVATLNASAGGTWLAVPASLGLSQVRFIRFTDPKWLLSSDGSLADSFDYFGSPTNAAIYLNAISANSAAVTPEPGTILLGSISLAFVIRRRRNG